MKFGMVTLTCAALAAISCPAMAQTQAKPALLIKPEAKPAGVWQPKVIQRSQLRPILKPAVPGAEEQPDVFVPPAQVNPLPAKVEASGAPVHLAAAHANVPTAQTAMANPLPAAVVRDFVGQYLGAGVEVALAPVATEPPRRLSQVEISGDVNEFTVRWATMRIGANFKAETVKSSQQELKFRPGAAPGHYVAVSAEAGQPAPQATAEIKDRTMTVVITGLNEAGGQSVQRYERTLTDQGMDVVFTRMEGGTLIRQVNLSLTRSGGSIWRNL